MPYPQGVQAYWRSRWTLCTPFVGRMVRGPWRAGSFWPTHCYAKVLLGLSINWSVAESSAAWPLATWAACHMASCLCRREGLAHVSKLLVWLHESGCKRAVFAAFGILSKSTTFTLIPVCMTCFIMFLFFNSTYHFSLQALDWECPGTFLVHSAPQILLYLAGSSCCVYCCGSLAQLQVWKIAKGFFRVVWISLWHALPTGCPSILTQSVDALHTVGRVWGAWWGVLEGLGVSGQPTAMLSGWQGDDALRCSLGSQ